MAESSAIGSQCCRHAEDLADLSVASASQHRHDADDLATAAANQRHDRAEDLVYPSEAGASSQTLYPFFKRL